MKKTILLAILFPLLTGCASAHTYFIDRARDFSDMFIIEGSQGPGIGARVEATRLFGTMVGLGVIDTHPVKFRDKELVRRKPGYEGVAEITCVGLGICSFVDEGGDMLPFHIGPVNWLTVAWLDWEYEEALPWILDTSVHVHAGYFGFRAGISPTEIADFLLGFSTLDFMDDDDLSLPDILVGHADADCRKAAANRMWKLCDPAHVRALEIALEDESKMVREAVQETLGKIRCMHGLDMEEEGGE
ncbi:MAG: HEAT repeat domain-containing protein [Planctomycetota bacterium]